jgi:hypothetical protein
LNLNQFQELIFIIAMTIAFSLKKQLNQPKNYTKYKNLCLFYVATNENSNLLLFPLKNLNTFTILKVCLFFNFKIS